jgi:hypothetical protein
MAFWKELLGGPSVDSGNLSGSAVESEGGSRPLGPSGEEWAEADTDVVAGLADDNAGVVTGLAIPKLLA